MTAIVAEATAVLDLAYDLYVETLDDLRAARVVSLDVLEDVHQHAELTGGSEAAALTYALCDYLADVPTRSRDHFYRIAVAPRPD